MQRREVDVGPSVGSTVDFGRREKINTVDYVLLHGRFCFVACSSRVGSVLFCCAFEQSSSEQGWFLSGVLLRFNGCFVSWF